MAAVLLPVTVSPVGWGGVRAKGRDLIKNFSLKIKYSH